MFYNEKQKNALKKVVEKTRKEMSAKDPSPIETLDTLVVMSVFIHTHGLKRKYEDFVRAVSTD